MTADQIRRQINQLEGELAALEKKMADEVKKEADKTKKISDIKRSITKSTSASTLGSKMRQIDTHQNDLTRVLSSKADINKKIADKKKKLNDLTLRLQREEIAERKKWENSQKDIQRNYERQIAELTSQIESESTYNNSGNLHLYMEGNEEYDVFISHASEDKESFVEQLFNELTALGIKVWYDSISIPWGSSLRHEIDSGLKKSKYGIVVVSKDYIRKGWTAYELDGLFQREMMGGKIILPVWHNITKTEVAEYSPSLAGRMALNTTNYNPKEIAEKLQDILEFKREKGID